MNVIGEMIIGDRNLAFFLEPFVNQYEIIAGVDVDSSVDVTDSYSRPLKIAEQRNRPSELGRETPDESYRLPVLRMSAMRKVEAGDIHSRLDQSSYRLFVRARGAKRADDFRARDVRCAHFDAARVLILRSIPAVN